VTGAPQTDPVPCRLAFGLMVASGFAALGYQIVWLQQSALWLGHDAAAVLAVVAAFFGGVALGALLLGPPIDRSAQPARWYAGCEAVIGLWGLVLVYFMAPANDWLQHLTGAQPAPAWQWAVTFCGTFLLLLPATAAMGATLPAMERVLAQLRYRGAGIAALYAGNTFGAVVGVLAAAFWLVPQLGLTRTAAVCIVLNLFCAVTALRLAAGPAYSTTPATAQAVARGSLLLLAATGLLGIGYEVLVVRVLSQVAENTVYTYALLLAVYLIGTALGAAAYQRWRVTASAAAQLRSHLLRALAAVCVLGTACLGGAETVKAVVLKALGPSVGAALAAEAALAAVAFLLPTVVMGALFSHLGTQARARGISFGHALGVNTLGAAAAPLLFGVILVPALGPKLALLLVAAGYLALSLCYREGAASPAAPALPAAFWVPAAAVVAMALWAPPLMFVEVPAGGRIVSYHEAAMATVSVLEDAQGVARLHINNRQQEGSSATQLADARQALLPLLLHPAPRRALFLGVGTGVTAAAAADDPTLQVDAVELLPEVIAASAYFRPSNAQPNLHLLTADARRYVRTSGSRYDLIVSDNFHPARSGSGALYTVEHFTAVRERLATGGVFCQWLPLHQLDLDTLRSIVRTFITVYPGGFALLATHSLDTPVVGLIVRGGGERFDAAQARGRLDSVATPQSPAAFGITDDLALLGSFIAGPQALAAFAGNAPLNSDDHPVVSYRAPRITYAPDTLARERLTALLRELEIRPDELIAAPHDPAWAARLAAYWTARNRFLEAGRDVRPSADVRHMLAQVREPLLAVLRISPDFRPAFDPLLGMATALGRVDVAAARALLTELQQAQPARPEAAQRLRELSGAALQPSRIQSGTEMREK
jgi:spermidine synthase